MSSEIIVVLVLTVLAVAFVLWIRMHARATESPREGEKTPGQGPSRE